MEKTIEAIWKEGFLNETSLVAPKINDLYNQKSMHVVEKVKSMFRVSISVIIVTAVVFPVVYYFLDAIWEGAAASVLLLLTAWYNKRQMDAINTLDHGATSLEYLKSLDRWLKDVLRKSENMARLSYPLYWLIALSTVRSAWNKQGLTSKLHQQFHALISIDDIVLFAQVSAVLSILLMFLFSAKIYRWELRLTYGGVFGKLQQTIAEMEKLKQV